MTHKEEIIAMLETLKEQAKTPVSIITTHLKNDTIIKNVSRDSFIFIIEKTIEALREVNNEQSKNGTVGKEESKRE